MIKEFIIMLKVTNLSSDIGWSESDNHARLQNSCLNSTNGDSSNTTNLVDILEGQTEGSVCRA